MRVYITPVKLHHISSNIPDICVKCLNQKGTLSHCLWECPKIEVFWEGLGLGLGFWTSSRNKNDCIMLEKCRTTITSNVEKGVDDMSWAGDVDVYC